MVQPNGVVVITGEGERQKAEDWGTGLYQRGTDKETDTLFRLGQPGSWRNEGMGRYKGECIKRH